MCQMRKYILYICTYIYGPDAQCVCTPLVCPYVRQSFFFSSSSSSFPKNSFGGKKVRKFFMTKSKNALIRSLFDMLTVGGHKARVPLSVYTHELFKTFPSDNIKCPDTNLSVQFFFVLSFLDYVCVRVCWLEDAREWENFYKIAANLERSTRILWHEKTTIFAQFLFGVAATDAASGFSFHVESGWFFIQSEFHLYVSLFFDDTPFLFASNNNNNTKSNNSKFVYLSCSHAHISQRSVYASTETDCSAPMRTITYELFRIYICSVSFALALFVYVSVRFALCASLCVIPFL